MAHSGGGGTTTYGHNANPYSTTTYGATGGANGGGFMGGSQGASQGGSKGTYGKETLRPVTIMQILEAEQPHPDADFKIDDVEVSQVSFVGQIRSLSRQTTNMTYRLDDGTGSIDVKVWIDSDTPTHDDQGNPLQAGGRNKLDEGQWVRVCGKLKAFNNRRHVGAFGVKRVKDMNEINYHLLSATYAHLYFVKGPIDPNGVQAGQQMGGQQPGAGGDSQMQDADGTGAGAGGYQRALPRLGATAQKVYKTIMDTPQGHEGLHVQQIAAGSGLTVNDVLKGGDELMGHALIFTTLDDHTWAVMTD